MIISVIGQGKLGKPISDVFSRFYKVIRLDKGDSFEKLGDITFVVVPTPSVEGRFTSEFVEDVLSNINIHHQPVVIVSTLMPGETDRLQNEHPHLVLHYNPTFVALGSVAYDFTHQDFVLIGSKQKSIDKLLEIHTKIKSSRNTCIMSPLEAEIAKLTLNCYITTKITFANQIGNLCHKLGINPKTILDSVGKDSRIGNKYFKAGLGYGGPCFPRDNVALSKFMEDNYYNPELFRLIHKLNGKQVYEICDRVKAMNPKTVGFSGLSYKQGSDVEEESHLKKIWERLTSRGFECKIGKGDVNLDWEGICE